MGPILMLAHGWPHLLFGCYIIQLSPLLLLTSLANTGSEGPSQAKAPAQLLSWFSFFMDGQSAGSDNWGGNHLPGR